MTVVHTGDIKQYTKGGFREWAYHLAQQEFGAELMDGGLWCQFKNSKTGKMIMVDDSIAGAFRQQI